MKQESICIFFIQRFFLLFSWNLLSRNIDEEEENEGEEEEEEEEYKGRADSNSPGGPHKAVCVATLRLQLLHVRGKG